MTVQVPGDSSVKLTFSSLELHGTDMLEIREGLRETDSFITSINTNQSRPVYSLTSQMFLLFKTNHWGQLAGFSAVFSRQSSVCGGREVFAGNSLSLGSPGLDPGGLYRRGYLACRWEAVAEHGHFITANFQEFHLNSSAGQCSSSFLELSDGVHDTDHVRRLCHNMAGRRWATASNKLFIEYLFDIEDTTVRL